MFEKERMFCAGFRCNIDDELFVELAWVPFSFPFALSHAGICYNLDILQEEHQPQAEPELEQEQDEDEDEEVEEDEDEEEDDDDWNLMIMLRI